MPWKEVSKMSLKSEFIALCREGSMSKAELCRRYGISRKTGYRLLSRYESFGEGGLACRSKRPLESPYRTGLEMEQKVLAVREWKPAWGGRKIHAYLRNQGEIHVPMPSTITNILHRYGLIEKSASEQREHYKRFEHACANDLWQVDFKGHIGMHRGRCHPLTVLDDHSRFSIGLRACSRESKTVVKRHFIEIFERYGLPYRMNFDNGNPWASGHSAHRHTSLTIWLIQLGIQVSYSRPRHPQTNGKDERFHRTLKEELLVHRTFFDIPDAQTHFDSWREEYNCIRPHEALGMQAPMSRYQVSTRRYEQERPEVTYPTDMMVRKVNQMGRISIGGHGVFVSEALRGLPVGLKVVGDGEYDVYFCRQKIRCIRLRHV